MFTLTIYFIILNVSLQFVLVYRPHPVVDEDSPAPLRQCLTVSHRAEWGGVVGWAVEQIGKLSWHKVAQMLLTHPLPPLSNVNDTKTDAQTFRYRR